MLEFFVIARTNALVCGHTQQHNKQENKPRMNTGIMNIGNLLTLLAVLLYLGCLILVLLHLRSRLKTAHSDTGDNYEGNVTSRNYLPVWFSALVVHIVALHYPLITGQTTSFNFIVIGSYVMWLINCILFITTLKRRIEILSIIILPITIFAVLASLTVNPGTNPIVNMKSGLGIHILFSLLAYSMLMLASFQALVLAVQNNNLHSHQNSTIMRTLPALEDMEHLLFRFIGIGVVLLSIGLLSGFYFLDNLFGANIAHKTILSIIAWLVFSILLYGRWQYGWRGKKAIHWTLAGFIVLMLAFFGTKIIQEFIGKSTTSALYIKSSPNKS